jgi:hypothetical protein
VGVDAAVCRCGLGFLAGHPKDEVFGRFAFFVFLWELTWEDERA